MAWPKLRSRASSPSGGRPGSQSTVSESQESPSTAQLRNELTGQGPVAAGQLVKALFETHSYYVSEGIGDLARSDDQLASLGPVRIVEEHLAAVRFSWDEKRVPVMRGRYVILGLALDPDVGWHLLKNGIVGSLLTGWQPGNGTAEEPYAVAWDLLSDSGRDIIEEQPLLAAAYGAPAQTTVTVPAPVQAMAWSPGGDRLAIVAGGILYEFRPERYEYRAESGTARPIGQFGKAVGSIGWSSYNGVVGLSIDGGHAELLRAQDGAVLSEQHGITSGLLSGDGLHALLETSDGVCRWTPTEPTVKLTPSVQSESAAPVAVDWTGRLGVLRLAKDSMLLVSSLPGSLPTQGTASGSPAADDVTPILTSVPSPSSPCALVKLGSQIAVAYAGSGGMEVSNVPDTLVCRIATGPDMANALAVDSAGTSLAVGIGNQIGVWPLGARAAPPLVPAYATDSPDQSGDLLDACRDAQAIATLISAREVDPPLSIGLFGAWGSGKSFVLQEIAKLLNTTGRPEGYLQHIKVVDFNAWQYAETNLWASLVDRVPDLRKLAVRNGQVFRRAADLPFEGSFLYGHVAQNSSPWSTSGGRILMLLIGRGFGGFNKLPQRRRSRSRRWWPFSSGTSGGLGSAGMNRHEGGDVRALR